MPAAAIALRPSRRLLRAAFLREMGLVFDRGVPACFELVPNEHVEIHEYPNRRSPSRERRTTTIIALADQPERRKGRR